MLFRSDLADCEYDDDFKSDRNINKVSNIRTIIGSDGKYYRIFASPSSKKSERPSTYDTYVHLLKNIDQKENHRLLALTNNRYCNTQCLQMAQAIFQSGKRSDIDGDVIGISDDSHLTKVKDYSPTGYSNDLIGLVEWIEIGRASCRERV